MASRVVVESSQSRLCENERHHVISDNPLAVFSWFQAGGVAPSHHVLEKRVLSFHSLQVLQCLVAAPLESPSQTV